MSDADDLEEALAELEDEMDKNVKARRRLTSEINHTTAIHRKNGKVYSDCYGNRPKETG